MYTLGWFCVFYWGRHCSREEDIVRLALAGLVYPAWRVQSSQGVSTKKQDIVSILGIWNTKQRDAFTSNRGATERGETKRDWTQTQQAASH
jgi:hypothetical protein